MDRGPDKAYISMSPRAELRLINTITRNSPFMKASELERELNKRTRVIRKRYSNTLDIQLDNEIRQSEIKKCLTILKDIR